MNKPAVINIPSDRYLEKTQGSNRQVGTASFHHFSTKCGLIDLDLNGTSVAMNSTRAFWSKHRFMSSTGRLTWRRDGWDGLEIMTDLKVVVARMERYKIGAEKQGKSEIMGGNISYEELDEIVVSGIAMMEHTRRIRRCLEAIVIL